MSQRDFLSQLVAALNESDIPFMVAGSMSSAHYGEPRSTNDIDIVIDPSPSQIDLFLAHVTDQFYVNPQTAADAFARRSMFNVIDTNTGWKADLIIRKDRPFSVSEFERRISVTLLGVPVFMATAEDVVLSKLEWSVKSESERQLRDVTSVIETLGDQIDMRYLRKWAVELNVENQLNKVLAAIEGS